MTVCDDADVIRARALGITEYEPIPPLPAPVYGLLRRTVSMSGRVPSSENGALNRALDLKNARMFLTDLGGSLYCCNLDGSEERALRIAKGNLSGIAYADIPR